MSAALPKQYNKWLVGLATAPIHCAVLLPIIFFVHTDWLIFVCYIPFWLVVDNIVYRLFIKQVVVLGRPRWQFLSFVAGTGVLLNALFFASSHALS